jgi:hypothetical protein
LNHEPEVTPVQPPVRFLKHCFIELLFLTSLVIGFAIIFYVIGLKA